MLMTTTPTIEEKKIKQYRGVVVAEAILGANQGYFSRMCGTSWLAGRRHADAECTATVIDE